MSGKHPHYDAIVIGAGLSGLLAAASLADAGARVYVLAKGGGYLHFTSGCVDVLGVDVHGRALDSPTSGLDTLTPESHTHPYALVGCESLVAGVSLFRRIMEERNYPFAGSLDQNILLPTALGSTRITALAPESMVAGNLRDEAPMLIAGFQNFRDFYPRYLATNLANRVPFPVHGLNLDVPRFRERRHLLSLDVARAFEDPQFRQEVSRAVQANLGEARRVGFPAVLGLQKSREVTEDLAQCIGMPVFEIPTLPPSVAGIRVDHALGAWATSRGARIEIGFWVRGRIEGDPEGARVTGIEVESAGRHTRYTADTVVLATGGIGGGGIVAEHSGSLRETVFRLPVEGPRDRTSWYQKDFLSPSPQPISLAGIRTNAKLQPLDGSGRPVRNLFVTGSNLAGWDPTREKSGEGVALATGWVAAREALQEMGKVNAVPARVH